MPNPMGTTLPDELLLGHIAWYTVTQPTVTHEDVSRLATENNLTARFVPKEPRLGDAFKRACRYSERKGIPIPHTSNTASVMIRDVDTTITHVERHMVLEIRDPDGRKLEYYDAVRLVFDRKDEVLNATKLSLPGSYQTIIDLAAQEFLTKFGIARKTIDAQQIRLQIRNELDAAGAVVPAALWVIVPPPSNVMNVMRPSAPSPPLRSTWPDVPPTPPVASRVAPLATVRFPREQR